VQRVAAPSRSVLAAFVAIVFIAGANVIVVRVSNAELAPFWGAALRFLVAGAILAVAALGMRLPFPRGAALGGTLLYGLLAFGVSYALAYWSLVGLSAGLFAVFIALVPLLTFFLAWAHGLEPFRWRGLLAALVVVCGIALILREQLSLSVPIPFLIGGLLTPVAMAESGIAAKFFPRTHPITTNAVAMGVGGLFLTVFSLLLHEPRTLPHRGRTIVAVAWLVLFGSVVMFVLFLYILARWTASAASYQMVLSPIVAIALAWILLGETVSWLFALGSIIVLGGVYLALQGPRPGTKVTSVEAPQNAASTTGAPRP
jgi:drug/metabolite transporter (DMT)-like permease